MAPEREDARVFCHRGSYLLRHDILRDPVLVGLGAADVEVNVDGHVLGLLCHDIGHGRHRLRDHALIATSASDQGGLRGKQESGVYGPRTRMHGDDLNYTVALLVLDEHRDWNTP